MIVRYLIAWIPMVAIAMINGLIREKWYGTHLDELRAHQISTVTLSVFFGLYLWAIGRVWQLESGGQSLGIGLMWLLMTVLFECIFGHYVAGHPWRRLGYDYNLFAGRLWGLFLAWVAVAPYIVYRLQR